MRNKAIDITPCPLDVLLELTVFDSCLSEVSSLDVVSSIAHYRYENGRRYHKYREGRMCVSAQVRIARATIIDTPIPKNAEYAFPNDEV